MKTLSLTTLEFRRALGHFTTGVTVVTVERTPGQAYGMTANSFTSVSLDPMLILICVSERSKILPLLQEKKQFGVNVLKESQEALSEYFAQSEQHAEAERRLSIHFRWTPVGVPLLEGALLQLTCKTVAAHLAGDHTIFLGEVEAAEIHEGKPLLYFRGEYRKIASHH